MAFLATQNNRGGLHVQDTDTLEHAEVESAAEAQEWFAAQNKRKQEAWAAQFAAPVAAAPPSFTPATVAQLTTLDPSLEQLTPQAAADAAAGHAAVAAVAPVPPSAPVAEAPIDYGALAAAILAQQHADAAAMEAQGPAAPATSVPRGN